MKEKLTITIESELLNSIEKNMVKANYNNKSKFVEFALNQLFFDPAKRLKFFEELREKKVRDLRDMNSYVLELQQKLELYNQKKELVECEIQDKQDKDALWGGNDGRC